MFTAAKVLERLEESDNIDGLDHWLEKYVCEKFIETDGYAVTVSFATLKQQGWKRKAFILAMEERGFSVQLFSEQRDGDYFLIHLRPLPYTKENKGN